MAIKTTMTPVHAHLHHHPAPTPLDHAYAANHWVSGLMLLATGAAVTLFVLAQLDSGPARTDGPIWLFIIIMLTAWPSYLAWRATMRLRCQLAELERRRIDGRTYEDGYAAGYLACAALMRPSAEPNAN